jgi:glycosyltransferase involved in cell wall biosynthesis
MNINEVLNIELKHHRSIFNKTHQNTQLYKEYIYNSNINIKFSVIVPVYNQELIIVNNLSSIIKHMGGTFELILILDFCKDNTKHNILNYFDKYKNENDNFYGITIYSEDTIPLFEATCDNIGFIFSKGTYCLEIQADMEMVEHNFNLQLEKPFKLLNNVIAVSGRCSHNFFDNKGIGKLGNTIEKSLDNLNINKNIFYTFETCNRGPLLLDKSKLSELLYLDEKNWYLDNSDHDLMYRAFYQKGYICGYVPINFLSPLQNGTTRKTLNKDINNENTRQIRIKENLFNNNFKNTKNEYYKELEPKQYNL